MAAKCFRDAPNRNRDALLPHRYARSVRVYKAVGRRERDGQFSGHLVAYYLAAKEKDADPGVPAGLKARHD